MKRLLIIFFSILLLASCQKESPVDAPEFTTMTYHVQPPVQFITKAGEGNKINILWYGVYHKKADGHYDYVEDMSAFVEITDPSDIKVPITLIRNQEYKLVFVAQHRVMINQSTHSYTYKINYTTGDMTLNSPVTDCECLDAFVKVDIVGPITRNENRNITLDRPFAQINLGTSAALPTTFDLELTGVPAAYNLFTGTCSQQTTTHTFTGLTPLGSTIKVAGVDYNYMTTLYIFGVNKIGGTVRYGSTETTFSNIDTAPNHKTNIVGNI